MDVKTSLTVRSMLENTSDGRDSRAYTVVCHLIRDGFTDEHIVDLVIGSPLGAKAERARPWDPQGWVQHKIDEARRSGVSPGESRLFDQEAAWFIARRAGLAPGTLRVLDYLMDSTTHPRGFVRRGQDQIALESAVGSGKGPVDNLIQTGWLVRLAEPEWVESEQMWTASLYRLCHPADLRDASSLRPVRPRHDPLRGLRGHDAFRSRAGSLSSAYGMLTVLYGLEGPVPSISDLVDLMGKSEKTVSRTVTLLARDGLIRDGVVVRAQAEVRSLLDRSSIRSGTAGARKRHLALIRQKRADYQEFLADRPRRVLERELQQIRERAPQWAVNAGLPRGEHAAFVERLLHDARSGIGTRPDDVNLDLDLTDFV